MEGKAPLSACDSCRNPGRCCSGFPLDTSTGALSKAESMLEAWALLMQISPEPLDFEPLFKGADGRWRWWCPHLTREGRCGIYATRPHFPCIDYKPKSDRLCVEHCFQFVRPKDEGRAEGGTDDAPSPVSSSR